MADRQYYEKILYQFNISPGLCSLDSANCETLEDLQTSMTFHPEGLLTLNISTDRCRFLMPTNHQGKCSPTFLGVKVVAKMSASVVVVYKSLDKAESTDVTLKL